MIFRWQKLKGFKNQKNSKEKKKPSIILPSEFVLAALMIPLISELGLNNSKRYLYPFPGSKSLTRRFSKGIIPQGFVSYQFCFQDFCLKKKGKKERKKKKKYYRWIFEIIQTISGKNKPPFFPCFYTTTLKKKKKMINKMILRKKIKIKIKFNLV